MSYGFQILTRPHVPTAGLVNQFLRVPVANVSDSMHRLFAAGADLRPLHDGSPMAGTALTIKTRPGDNLMVHKALNMASPGDVLVIDAGGDLSNAILGELMLSFALKIGVAGVVLNGAVRDSEWISQNSLPVYAAGITHRGPYKDGPGEINVPVSMNGMVIHPGDIIIGDRDGVLAVPYAEADEILQRAQAKHHAETQQLTDIEAGTVDRSWVDRRLAEAGYSQNVPVI
jgi:RraA family protein